MCLNRLLVLSHVFLFFVFDFFSQGFEYVCTKNGVDIYQGTVPGSQVFKLCWHSAKMTLFSSVVVNITLSIKKESSLKAFLCFSVSPAIEFYFIFTTQHIIGLLDSQPVRLLETPRSLSVYVAVQFYPCFKCYFPLF